MRRPALFLLMLLTLSCLGAAAQTHDACYHHDVAGGTPRERDVDMERVVLRVRFDPPKGRVEGQVVHHFEVLRERVDSLFFDAPGVEIKSAFLGGKPLRFKTSATGVTVYPETPLRWDQRDSIRFEFAAQPRKGLYFIGWQDSTNRSRRQLWTQGQGTDHRYWFPCFDDPIDKVITETIITFDPDYKVISNGRLKSIALNRDGTKTWHYVMDKPHALYLLMLAIGKYDVEYRETMKGRRVALWHYPDHGDRVRFTYPHSTECIDFMEEQTGLPFPWEGYANVPVQDFIYGAMENTTATIFGDFFCVDERGFNDRNYIGVNVHELTHQWFGDYITLRAAYDIWLHESFATYYPKLYFRKMKGEDYYQWQRRGEQESALAASKADRLPIRHTGAGATRFYSKGSAVIDMMNYVWGSAAYRRVIHHYLKRHAYASVETPDFIQSFQDTLGVSPHWFFDQWILKGGEPHYHVTTQDVVKPTGRQTQFTVRQVQPRDNYSGLFRMPIVFQVHYTDGSADSLRAWVEKETEIITVPNPRNREIAFTLFDPGSWVLKQLKFEKSTEEWIYQAAAAPQMIDRYDALVALRDVPLEKKRAVLIDAFDREKFHALRGEAMRQLVGDDNPRGRSVLRRALRSDDVDVQKAAASALKPIPKDLRDDYENLLNAQSWNLITEALDQLATDFPHLREQYLNRTKDLVGDSYKVRCKWLEISHQLGDASAAPLLADLAGNSYEFITRQNAMRSLVKINYLDDAAVAGLVDALVSPNGRLAAVAREAIDHFRRQAVYRQRIDSYCRNRRWSGEPATIIQNLLKS
jgi:aminopeptidase N